MANMSLEKTTEELIFELGNSAHFLTLFQTQGININEVEFRLVQAPYEAFKTKALMLGVSLPDLTEDTLSEEFLGAQIAKAHDYIKRHKTASMAQLFKTGKAVKLIIFINNYAIQDHF